MAFDTSTPPSPPAGPLRSANTTPAVGETVTLVAAVPDPGTAWAGHGLVVSGRKRSGFGSGKAVRAGMPGIVYQDIARVQVTVSAPAEPVATAVSPSTDGSVVSAVPAPFAEPADLATRVADLQKLYADFTSGTSTPSVWQAGQSPRDNAQLLIWDAFRNDSDGFARALNCDDLGDALGLAALQMRRTIARDTSRPVEQRARWVPASPQVRARIDRELAHLATQVDKPKDPPQPVSANGMQQVSLSSNIEAVEHRRWLEYLLEQPLEEPDPVPAPTVEAVTAELNSRHYGMEEAKAQIRDVAIAVVRWQDRSQTDPDFMDADHPPVPAFLFIGPYGVGKTSSGTGLATALGRPFVKIACGGVDDAATLKGLDRGYKGSHPGEIAKALAALGTKRGILLLDEVDKIGSNGVKGDPIAVIMALTDHETNSTFRDDFLDGVDLDLSEMVIVMTANDLSRVNPGLLNRSTIVQFRGYSEREKLVIADKYLLDGVRAEQHMRPGEFEPTTEAVQALISSHTTEAGVRQLRLKLATLLNRAYADPDTGPEVSAEDVTRLLGPGQPVLDELPDPAPGNGRALWVSDFGGGTSGLQLRLRPGKPGDNVVTGTVKEMPVEMLDVAKTLAFTRLGEWWSGHGGGRLRLRDLQSQALHMHWNRTGMPKDGPSAGLATYMALASLLSGEVLPADLAMTGEINLEEKVQAVGGIADKVTAAWSEGIRRVLIPRENEREIAQIPPDVLEDVKVIPVGHVNEALEICFGTQLAARSGRGSLLRSGLTVASRVLTATSHAAPGRRPDVHPAARRPRVQRPKQLS